MGTTLDRAVILISVIGTIFAGATLIICFLQLREMRRANREADETSGDEGWLIDLMQDGPIPAHRAINITIGIITAVLKFRDRLNIWTILNPWELYVYENGSVSFLRYEPGLAGSEPPPLTTTNEDGSSIQYKSPEHLRNENLDDTSIVFIVGILFYQMITGIHPFADQDASDTEHNALTGAFKAIDTCQDLPIPAILDLTRLFSTMLAAERANRYASLKRMKNALVQVRKRLLPLLSRRERTPLAFRTHAYHYYAILGMTVCLLFLLIVPGVYSVPIGRILDLVRYVRSIAGPQKIVIVSGFASSTPDTFDSEIRDRVASCLMQSRQIRVFTSQEIYHFLGLMKRDTATSISAALADTIAQFAGNVDGVISGTLYKHGSQARLDITVSRPGSRDCLCKHELATRIEYNGDSLPDVCQAVHGKLVDCIVSLPEAQPPGRGLWIYSEVTTTSLEALKDYRQALGKMGLDSLERAAIFAEHATFSDPTFAMGYGIRGRIAWLRQDVSSAISFYRRAVELSSDLTEPEQLWLAAGYAFVQGNYNNAIEKYVLLLDRCGTDFWTHWDLSQCYIFRRDLVKAAEHLQAALKMDPNNPQLNAIGIRFELHRSNGNIFKAIACRDRIRNTHPDFDDPDYLSVGPISSWLQGDLARADTAFGRISDSVGNLSSRTYRIIQMRYANFELYIGRFDKALGITQTSIERATMRNDSISLALLKTQRGIIAWRISETREFDSTMFSLLRAFPSQVTGCAAGLLAYYEALEGRPDVARMFKDILLTSGIDSTEIKAFTYLISGAECEAAGDSVSAFQNYFAATQLYPLQYSGSEPHHFQSIWAHEALALAYEKLGRYDDAIKCWMTIINMKQPIVLDYPMGSFTWVMAHYRVGCLYDNDDPKVHDPQKAAEYLQKFLDLWRNSDRPVPEIEDAKRRLERLRAEKIQADAAEPEPFLDPTRPGLTFPYSISASSQHP